MVVSVNTVLIVSADPDFASKVLARWQSHPAAFVTMGDACAAEGVLAVCDLAICGPVPGDSLLGILRCLHAAGRPVICLASDPVAASTYRQAHPLAVVLPQEECWFENMIAVGQQLLRCAESSAQARRDEAALAQAEIQAGLGRFILDMRHGLNNALTSILGNAELLLLEPEKLSPELHEQIATMHEMALRIHDVILRFTALEQESRIAGASQHDMPMAPRPMLHSALPHPEAHDGIAAHGSGLS